LKLDSRTKFEIMVFARNNDVRAESNDFSMIDKRSAPRARSVAGRATRPVVRSRRAAFRWLSGGRESLKRKQFPRARKTALGDIGFSANASFRTSFRNAPREDVPSERASLIASRYVVLFSLA